MTNPLTELNRIQDKMLHLHLPVNRLFDKDVLQDFSYIAGNSPCIFMLQDMHNVHPAYVDPKLYTLLGYNEDEPLMSFQEHLHQTGWLSRYGEYCDFYKAQRDSEYTATLPLLTKDGTTVTLLMVSLYLKSYSRSGNAVLSILIPYTMLWDKEDKTSAKRKKYTNPVTEKHKRFFEEFDKLEKENKLIVQCLFEGKNYEETGKLIFRTKHTVKNRKPKIFKQLGINSSNELVCMYNDMKKFKNRA